MVVKDKLAGLLNKNVAILCQRFQYRGTLKEIGEDYIVLQNASAVEDSGSSSGDVPDREDPFTSDVTILFRSIEIVYQPKWCFSEVKSRIPHRGQVK